MVIEYNNGHSKDYWLRADAIDRIIHKVSKKDKRNVSIFLSEIKNPQNAASG